MEKSKLIWRQFKISFPLEAHKSNAIIHHTVGLMSDSRTPYLRHWKLIMVKQIKIQVEKHSTQPKRYFQSTSFQSTKQKLTQSFGNHVHYKLNLGLKVNL
ncbi:hypothetical protein KEM48_002319 [Puccinia striiformis f. sp. tritici PST-130]|nr:hypothetical protein KEM48_002319 [Puccinia striiformis f. sp. tritici PST-130]